VERWFLGLAHEAVLLALYGGLDPLGDFGIFGAGVVGGGGGLAVLLADAVGFGEGGEPGVFEEHAVCRTQIGDLVQAAAHEVAGHRRESLFR